MLESDPFPKHFLHRWLDKTLYSLLILINFCIPVISQREKRHIIIGKKILLSMQSYQLNQKHHSNLIAKNQRKKKSVFLNWIKKQTKKEEKKALENLCLSVPFSFQILHNEIHVNNTSMRLYLRDNMTLYQMYHIHLISDNCFWK